MSRCGQTVIEKLDWLNLGLLKDDLTARSDHEGRVVELISWRGGSSAHDEVLGVPVAPVAHALWYLVVKVNAYPVFSQVKRRG